MKADCQGIVGKPRGREGSKRGVEKEGEGVRRETGERKG